MVPRDWEKEIRDNNALGKVCEKFGLANPLALKDERMYYYAMELSRGEKAGWLGKTWMLSHAKDTADLYAMYFFGFRRR